jgi:sugar/nucleoside kinase (ribokinase family)
MNYDVFGIGNALVDMEYEVSDAFITNNKIEKGMMTLVEEDIQAQLISALAGDNRTAQKRQCGGSAANSIIGVSQFGGSSFYSFKVAGDDTGKFYLGDMKENGVATKNTEENLPDGTTGKCIVMVSDDAERTMHTFLGITGSLDETQIDEEALKASKWLYVEGYLVASPTGNEAAKKAIKIAKDNGVKTSFTMSDPNMVKFFKDNMNSIVGEGLDLVFCNEQEALEYTGAADINTAKESLKSVAKTFVITLGDKGAVAFDGEKFIEIGSHAVKAIDSNGAGDMFAGAFLYGITNGLDYKKAGELASLASSKVVSQFGPRLTANQAKETLSTFQG